MHGTNLAKKLAIFLIDLYNLCYTFYMGIERSFWLGWAHFLQRWGLDEFVALLLESLGPLKIFFAQLVYIGQPLLGRASPDSSWQAVAHLLENEEESMTFAAFLHQEKSK